MVTSHYSYQEDEQLKVVEIRRLLFQIKLNMINIQKQTEIIWKHHKQKEIQLRK